MGRLHPGQVGSLSADFTRVLAEFLQKVLISVLVFYTAVIYPCESRGSHAYALEPETDPQHQSQFQAQQSQLRQFSPSYEIERASTIYSNYNHLVSPKQMQTIIQRGKIFSSQIGDFLENIGFFPVTLNVPDILSGLASWFPSNGPASTPRKFFKMLSKMYKEIATDPDLKDELKIISSHASDFQSGFKTFWEAIDFSEEFEAVMKYFMK